MGFCRSRKLREMSRMLRGGGLASVASFVSLLLALTPLQLLAGNRPVTSLSFTRFVWLLTIVILDSFVSFYFHQCELTERYSIGRMTWSLSFNLESNLEARLTISPLRRLRQPQPPWNAHLTGCCCTKSTVETTITKPSNENGKDHASCTSGHWPFLPVWEQKLEQMSTSTSYWWSVRRHILVDRVINRGVCGAVEDLHGRFVAVSRISMEKSVAACGSPVKRVEPPVALNLEVAVHTQGLRLQLPMEKTGENK